MDKDMVFDRLSVRPAWVERQGLPGVVSAREILTREAEAIEFDPVPHAYREKATGYVPVCVSDVVESFSTFDDISKSKQIAKRDYDNPMSKYYHMTAEQILSMWHEKRDAAAARGSLRHAFAEACFEVVLGRPENVEPAWADRLSDDGSSITAIEPEEKAIVEAYSKMPDTLVPVIKECRLLNRELGYAGTLDLLSYDIVVDGYALLDWKTNESLDKGHFDRMRAPFADLWDISLNHYVLQQSMYELRLNQLMLRIIGRFLLHVRPDGVFSPVAIIEKKAAIQMVLAERLRCGLDAAGKLAA